MLNIIITGPFRFLLENGREWSKAVGVCLRDGYSVAEVPEDFGPTGIRIPAYEYWDRTARNQIGGLGAFYNKYDAAKVADFINILTARFGNIPVQDNTGLFPELVVPYPVFDPKSAYLVRKSKKYILVCVPKCCAGENGADVRVKFDLSENILGIWGVNENCSEILKSNLLEQAKNFMRAELGIVKQ